MPGLSCIAPSSGDDDDVPCFRAKKCGAFSLIFFWKVGGGNTAPWTCKTTKVMEYFSLKRSTVADRGQANLSSKVYVRSTKSGKVQKIVRELYLRQDIPCSSNLCRECLEIAPTDYSKKGWLSVLVRRVQLMSDSCAVCTFRHTSRIQSLSQWPVPRSGHQCLLDRNGFVRG